MWTWNLCSVCDSVYRCVCRRSHNAVLQEALIVTYTAGMSDVLAPFLELYPKDDALAYLCFSSLMQRIRLNYVEGQSGVHASLQQITSLLQKVDRKLWKQIGMQW